MSSLADRYPRRSPRRLPLYVTIAVLAVVGLSWLAWTALYHVQSPVNARIESFEIASDRDVRGSLVVDRADPSKPATCSLFAQASSFERVGEMEVKVAPSTTKVSRTPVQMRTFKRATTLTVEACHSN